MQIKVSSSKANTPTMLKRIVGIQRMESATTPTTTVQEEVRDKEAMEGKDEIKIKCHLLTDME